MLRGILLIACIVSFAECGNFMWWQLGKTTNSMTRKPVKLRVPIDGIEVNEIDRKLLQPSESDSKNIVYRNPSLLKRILTQLKLNCLNMLFPWVRLPQNMILKIKIEGDLTYEKSLFPSMAALTSDNTALSVRSIPDLMKLMNFAAHDPRVSCVFVELGSMKSSFTTMQELMRIFKYYSSSSKPLIGYSEGIIQEEEYLLSRSFQEFYVSPISELQLYGFKTECTSYGSLVKRLGIEVQSCNVGEYKSYGNEYTQEQLSTKDRELYSTILYRHSIHWLHTVADSLNITTKQLQEYTWNAHRPFTLSEYQDKQMITGILYPDQVDTLLTRRYINYPKRISPILVATFVTKWVFGIYEVCKKTSFSCKQIGFLWKHKETVDHFIQSIARLTVNELLGIYLGVRNVIRLITFVKDVLYFVMEDTRRRQQQVNMTTTIGGVPDTFPVIHASATDKTTLNGKALPKMRYDLDLDYAVFPRRMLLSTTKKDISQHCDLLPTNPSLSMNMRKESVHAIEAGTEHENDLEQAWNISTTKTIFQDRVRNSFYRLTSLPSRCAHWMKVQLPRYVSATTQQVKQTCHTLLHTLQHRLTDNHTIPDAIQYSQACIVNTSQLAYHTTEQLIYEEQTFVPAWIPAFSYLSRFLFAKYILPPTPYEETSAGPRIAIIPLLGSIHSSHTADGSHTGSSSSSIHLPHVRAALTAAMNDPLIHAIVLRIDSPGGDYHTSDRLWREIRMVAQRKPIVASMGSICTSGGYYLAMACDQIVAEESTITGSIGVATSKYSIEKLLKTFGIHREYLSIGRYAQMGIQGKAYSSSEYSIAQQSAKDAYLIFLSKAAKARNMTMKAMEKVAKGRVWTGKQAFHHGLVDHIGGVWKAIDIAVGLLSPQIQRKHFASGYKIQYLQPHHDFSSLLSSLPPLLSSQQEEIGINQGRKNALLLQAADSLHSTISTRKDNGARQAMRRVMHTDHSPLAYVPYYSLWAIPFVEKYQSQY